MHAALNRALPLIVLIGAAMTLGLAPILVRLSEAGPAATGVWRLAFALPMLILLTARQPHAGDGEVQGWGGGLGRPSRWMLLAGVFFALDLSVWHYGVVLTSVANATLLCNLAPIVVTLFGWIVFKETPKRLFVMAMGLALGGGLAMSIGAAGGQGSNPPLGDLLSFSAAIWIGAYFLAIKAARATAGALRVMTWSSVAALPVMLLAAVLMGEALTPATAGGWAACLGLGVMHVIGQGGVAWSLGRLPAALTALVVLLQPVVSAALGWVLFSESMTPIQLFGAALVLAGIVAAQRSNARSTPVAAPAPA